MPTARGWIVAGTGLLLIAVGAFSHYRELVLLGGIALAATVAAVAFVGRPAGVSVHRSPSVVRTSPGGVLSVRLGLRNTGRRALRVGEPVTGGAHVCELALAPLRGHTGATPEYRLQPVRRGLLRLGPVRAGRADPLGLAGAWRSHGATHHVWVHPPWRYLRTVPSGRVVDPDGEVDGVEAGTLTFHTLRDYVPGDDLRRVHWRSSARLDRLVVREYVDTSRTRVCVIVDDRPTQGGSARLDEVASAAASVLTTAVRASLHCELRLVSGRTRDSTAGPAPLLDLLAEAEPDPGADLAGALSSAAARPGGDTAVLLGGALDATDLGLFVRLGAGYAGLVAVSIGAERVPPAPGGLTLIAAGDSADFADRWNEAPWRR